MYRRCWKPVKETLSLSCEVNTIRRRAQHFCCIMAIRGLPRQQACRMCSISTLYHTDAEKHLLCTMHLREGPAADYSIGLVQAEGRSEILVVLLQIALFFHPGAEWLPLPLVIALLLPDESMENINCVNTYINRIEIHPNRACLQWLHKHGNFFVLSWYVI